HYCRVVVRRLQTAEAKISDWQARRQLSGETRYSRKLEKTRHRHHYYKKKRKRKTTYPAIHTETRPSEHSQRAQAASETRGHTTAAHSGGKTGASEASTH